MRAQELSPARPDSCGSSHVAGVPPRSPGIPGPDDRLAAPAVRPPPGRAQSAMRGVGGLHVRRYDRGQGFGFGVAEGELDALAIDIDSDQA